MTRYLVAGGAGFIGSNFVHHVLESDPASTVLNFDKLTYAGNLENLLDLEGEPRYAFRRGDITDAAAVEAAMATGIDVIVNFAAETHVDRSIQDASDFITTDVYGAYVLLEAGRRHGVRRFVQVSTDEVYGSISGGSFTEESTLMPSSPYAASKAGGDRLAYSYYVTYNLPVLIARASNNYGPYQYPEKLIPLFITNALEDRPLPLFGDGQNVRDWLHVRDHCAAILLVVEKGRVGEVYNIGGGNERTNLEITRLILAELGKSQDLIAFVGDRPGHDRRYSVDCTKLRKLGYRPRYALDEGLRATVAWYVEHRWWWEKIKNGTFRQYYQQMYADR